MTGAAKKRKETKVADHGLGAYILRPSAPQAAVGGASSLPLCQAVQRKTLCMLDAAIARQCHDTTFEILQDCGALRSCDDCMQVQKGSEGVGQYCVCAWQRQRLAIILAVLATFVCFVYSRLHKPKQGGT